MTDEGKAEAVAAEIALADEELRAADELLAKGLARVSLTRAYFAVFHALRARLYADGHEPRSQAGVLHLFNLHFVKTGRFEPATSRVIARLQKFREEAEIRGVVRGRRGWCRRGTGGGARPGRASAPGSGRLISGRTASPG